MDLESSLLDVIKEFRRKLADVPPDRQGLVQQLMDLRAPCQITGISFTFPWQAFVLTHSRTAPDLRVRIHQRVEPWDAIDVLEKELEDRLWDDDWQPDEFHRRRIEPDGKLRSVGANAFANIYDEMRVWIAQDFSKHSGKHMSRQILSSRAALWNHIGNPANIDWKEILHDSFARAKAPSVPTPPQPAAATGYVEPRHVGRGAYHRPIFRVGKPYGAKPLQMRLWSEHVSPGFLVLNDRLGPHELLVTHNGFLGLITENETEALQWLNLAMAAFRSLGHASRPVHESGLAQFNRPDANHWIGWGGMFPESPTKDEVQWAGHWLSENEFKHGLRKAEELAGELYSNRLPWLLEAEAHLSDSEFPQSLIFSWAVIEESVTQRWDSFLDSKQISGKRRDGFLNNREWSIQTRLDALQLAGEIPQELFDQLVKTKNVRNKAMHGKEFPDREQAAAALLVAEEVLLGDAPRILVPTRNPWDDVEFL